MNPEQKKEKSLPKSEQQPNQDQCFEDTRRRYFELLIKEFVEKPIEKHDPERGSRKRKADSE